MYVTVTQTLNSENVFVDTTAPVLTLNGSSNVTIELGSAYHDLEAFVSDDDPLYDGTISYNTINSSNVGVYTVTYTAPADLAGNVPAAITRTVTIADTTAPSKLNLTASSDNSNADRARAGDTITVTLVADMDIASASAIILNKTANVTISDNIVSSTIVVLAGDSGNTTFTTIVQDPSGNSLTVTQTDLNSENVFVDTTAPVLTLNGSSNVTIELGSAYHDLEAFVSDDDPLYDGTISYNTINSSNVGVYTVTYTAPADLAGNVPAAITRTVTIADTTAPSKLNLTASSDNSNADRARAGDTITVTLVADMDIASASAIILNKTANVTISDNIVSSTIVVLAGDSGNTTFTTIVQDPSGNSLTVTQTDLNSENVFVDTTAPVLTLNGSSNVTIELGSAYHDLEAFVSDDDPLYDGTISYNTINSSNVGVYTVTYTAPADLAGNVPAAITRTVTIADTTAPSKLNLTASSDNSNADRARAGDTITVTLVADMDIASASAIILNKTANVTISDNIVSSTIVVLAGDSGNTTFTTIVQDPSGNSLTVTQTDLNSENVFVDTTAPVLTLNGSSNVTIELGSVYHDLEAFVSDDDPLYDGTISYNTINSSNVGVYTVTYTAPADLAGNVPAAITRTVTIADTTAPSKLNLTASSDNSNADRARAGDTITVTLVADMDIASASAIILNKTANVTISDNIVSSTIVVLAGDSGNTTFTTIVQDPSGNSLTVTQTDLNSENVFVDQNSPILALKYSSDVMVELGMVYSDPGAIIFENDPKYAGTVFFCFKRKYIYRGRIYNTILGYSRFSRKYT